MLVPGLIAAVSQATAAPSGWEIGLNFRATENYVPDVPPDTWFRGIISTNWEIYDSGAGTITEVRAENIVSAPYDDAGADIYDSRLAGQLYRSGGSPLRLAMKVPAGFSYRIRTGHGDIQSAATGTGFDIQEESGGTVVYSLPLTPRGANQYMDILGNITTRAVWLANYATNYTTVTPVDNGADTQLVFQFTGNDSYLNHLRVEQV